MQPDTFVSQHLAYRLSVWALGMFSLGAMVFAAQRHWLRIDGLALWPCIRSSLPSFTHTYAIALLACVWLAKSWRQALCIGLACAALDLGLEALQHPALHDWLGSPAWARSWLVSTFDTGDLAAIMLGLCAAWCSLALGRQLQQKGEL